MEPLKVGLGILQLLVDASGEGTGDGVGLFPNKALHQRALVDIGHPLGGNDVIIVGAVFVHKSMIMGMRSARLTLKLKV